MDLLSINQVVEICSLVIFRSLSMQTWDNCNVVIIRKILKVTKHWIWTLLTDILFCFWPHSWSMAFDVPSPYTAWGWWELLNQLRRRPKPDRTWGRWAFSNTRCKGSSFDHTEGHYGPWGWLLVVKPVSQVSRPTVTCPPKNHQFDRFAQYKTACNSRSESWLGGWGLGQQVKRTIQVISLQIWTDFIFLHKILDFKRGRAGP